MRAEGRDSMCPIPSGSKHPVFKVSASKKQLRVWCLELETSSLGETVGVSHGWY